MIGITLGWPRARDFQFYLMRTWIVVTSMSLLKIIDTGEVTHFLEVSVYRLDCVSRLNLVGFEEPGKEQWNVVPYEGLELTLRLSGFLTTMTTPQRTPQKGSRYYRRRVVPPQNHNKRVYHVYE